jgi:uncharacterized membrane protein
VRSPFGPQPLQLHILSAFLVLGALFGACYAVLLPPLQAPDEFAHFFRAYNVSEGSCVAPVFSPIPLTIEEMAAAFQPHLEEERRIGPDYILAFFRHPLNESRQGDVANPAINVYSCVPYAPAALGIRAGRLFAVSPAGILYLARFANLIAYLSIVYLALRQLPGFQIPLLSLALMPMALNQAASASWDGVAFAMAFFLCSYIVRLAWDPGISTLRTSHYLTLGIAVVLAALCKADVWLVPLLILVPASRFSNVRRKIAAVLGYLLLAMAVMAVWNYVNRQNTAQWIEHIAGRHIQFSDNFAFIFQHPWMFLHAFIRSWVLLGHNIAAEFIGKLGWIAVILPAWAIWTYYLLLGFVALTDTSEIRMTAGHRLLCLGVAALAITSVFVAIWCADTSLADRDNALHGRGLIGVQGRYFIPFALPILLALSNISLTRGPRVNRKWLLAIAAAAIFTVNAVALQDIRETYYLGGVAGPYENKLVRRPGTTVEDGKVFLIRGGRRHWVVFASWLVKHGYHWPDDVLTIPADQLNSIPEGGAINEQ